MEDFLNLDSKYWTFIIIPILVPLLAFSLGSLYSMIKTKKEKLRQYKKLESYYGTWITLIKTQIEKQISSLNQFNSQLKENEATPLNCELFNLHVDKFFLFNSLENYSLFVLNKKAPIDEKLSTFFKFENHIRGLQSSDKNIDVAIDNWKENAIAISNDFENQIHRLHDIHRKVIETRSENTTNNIFFSTYNLNYNEWVSEKDSSSKRLKKCSLISLSPSVKIILTGIGVIRMRMMY